MKQTEHISLGGYSLTIEEDAYRALDNYIHGLKEAYGHDAFAEEIMNDIEGRIAELLIEKCGKGGIVNIGAVSYVTERVGTPSQLSGENGDDIGGSGLEKDGQAGTGADNNEATRGRRIFRDLDRRMFGGVCSGLSAYLDIDVTFLRIPLVLCFICGFFTDGIMFFVTLLFYLTLWLCIPVAKTVEDKCRMKKQPIAAADFKERYDNGSRAVIHSGTNAREGNSAGRVLSVIIGVILIITGASGLMNCLFFGMYKSIAINSLTVLPYDTWVAEFTMSYLTDPSTWLLCGICTALFSIWILYNGVLLAFGMKAPRWKPGLVIFIMWLVSVLLLCFYSTFMMVDFLPGSVF